MSSNGHEIAPVDAGDIMEAVIAKGDLAKLTPAERALYYKRTCDSMGLNPLTKPFEYIVLNGKHTLYATRTATDQLRRINGVSVTNVQRETTPDGVHIVTVKVRDSTGREDEEIGAVMIAGLKGEALANAYMKATTKAKRRATLSISGLGWLDESELDNIPDARRGAVSSYVPDDLPAVDVDADTGEIADVSESEQLARLVDGLDGETSDMDPVVEEYYGAILGAETVSRLQHIAGELRGAGINDDRLRAAWATRLVEVKGRKAAEAEQPALAEAGALSGPEKERR